VRFFKNRCRRSTDVAMLCQKNSSNLKQMVALFLYEYTLHNTIFPINLKVLLWDILSMAEGKFRFSLLLALLLVGVARILGRKVTCGPSSASGYTRMISPSRRYQLRAKSGSSLATPPSCLTVQLDHAALAYFTSMYVSPTHIHQHTTQKYRYSVGTTPTKRQRHKRQRQLGERFQCALNL
jgi:hypothetical protein